MKPSSPSVSKSSSTGSVKGMVSSCYMYVEKPLKNTLRWLCTVDQLNNVPEEPSGDENVLSFCE